MFVINELEHFRRCVAKSFDSKTYRFVDSSNAHTSPSSSSSSSSLKILFIILNFVSCDPLFQFQSQYHYRWRAFDLINFSLTSMAFNTNDVTFDDNNIDGSYSFHTAHQCLIFNKLNCASNPVLKPPLQDAEQHKRCGRIYQWAHSNSTAAIIYLAAHVLCVFSSYLCGVPAFVRTLEMCGWKASMSNKSGHCQARKWMIGLWSWDQRKWCCNGCYT